MGLASQLEELEHATYARIDQIQQVYESKQVSAPSLSHAGLRESERQSEEKMFKMMSCVRKLTKITRTKRGE